MTTNTTAPAVAADQVELVLGAFAEPIPVSFSLETAHENVAVVRLQGSSQYHLAVHAVSGTGRSAWNLLPSAYPNVAAALALVPAVVLNHLS